MAFIVENGYMMKNLSSFELKEFIDNLRVAYFDYFYINHTNLLNSLFLHKLFQETVFYKVIRSNMEYSVLSAGGRDALEDSIILLGYATLKDQEVWDGVQLDYETALKRFGTFNQGPFIRYLAAFVYSANNLNVDYGVRFLDTACDAECKIFIYPDRNNIKFQVMGEPLEEFMRYLVSGKDKETINKLEHIRRLLQYDIKEYSFNDEIKPPKEVTEANWKRREGTWNRLIPNGYPYADAMVVDVADNKFMFDYNTWIFDRLSEEELYRDILMGMSIISATKNAETFLDETLREDKFQDLIKLAPEELRNKKDTIEEIEKIVEKYMANRTPDMIENYNKTLEEMEQHLIDWTHPIIKAMLFTDWFSKDKPKFTIPQFLQLPLKEMEKLGIFLTGENIDMYNHIKDLASESVAKVGKTYWNYHALELNKVLKCINGLPYEDNSNNKKGE